MTAETEARAQGPGEPEAASSVEDERRRRARVLISRVRVKLAETPAEWAGAVAVRLAVFVDEQGVPLAAELDERDRSAIHAVAVAPLESLAAAEGGRDLLDEARTGTAARALAQAGKYLPLSLTGPRGSARDVGSIEPVVGTGRLVRAGAGPARIGRLCVLPPWRGLGLGSRLLRLLEEAALARGTTRVLVHAQLAARAFYEQRGYTLESPPEVFLEDGIPHVRMTRSLSIDM